MDGLHQAALDELSSAFAQLFDPEPPPPFVVLPKQVRLTGLGGLIGQAVAPDTPGEVFGRRVEGEILAMVQGNDLEALHEAAAAAVRTALSFGRADLVARGFLRLSLEALGEVRQRTPAQLEQAVHFEVLFEFRQLPEADGDRIDTIPVGLEHDDQDEDFVITQPNSP